MTTPTSNPALATMAVRERHLRGASGALFAIELGEGRPVLLLHGVTANAYVWLPVMERLADRYRTFAIDQRGHGRSGAAPDGRYDAEAYAEDVVQATGSLEDGPVVVVGHSLGARNALEAGARRPDVVAGVVAIDFTPYVESSVYDALDSRIAAGDQHFDSELDVISYLSTRYPGLGRDAIARRAAFGFCPSTGGSLAPLADPDAMRATAAGLRDDLASALSRLEVPAVLVRGARSAFVSEAAFDATRRLRPDIRTVVIEGADHYVPEERPDEVARVVDALASEAFAKR